ncbi:MAG: hypothetical protein VR75_04965 [Hyphomonadaceae bacterium BRH_c29]|nr:MAG: hypothetical protein VR75_04965 [Hyphomonadaceae bacterium BRH_c29]
MRPDELLDLATFLRKFEQRASGIMWLLGAGASRASGIRTANDMIWDFKARLYRSAKSVAASSVSDLGDERTRQILQNYFDKETSNPASGSEEEYAVYFEQTYPEAQDRQRYIANAMRDAKPSYGHHALAHLVKKDMVRIIWTTNFDRLVEDAIHTVFETTTVLTIGDLGEPTKISRAFADQQWPIYAKLHGDFHSEALKNTSGELLAQDQNMRRILLDACRNQGLVVTGYSGRDASVMDVLREAVNEGVGFPNGLFWFVREQDTPYASVQSLILDAKAAGIDASFVRYGGFDELLSDIVRYLPQTEQLSIKLDDKRKIRPRPIDLSARTWRTPFVRTNAIPVLEYPKTARLVDCDIGGAKEIQAAISEAGSDLLASRIGKGVLAYGDDVEIKRVLGDHNIKSFDMHGILADRLLFESGERSLLRDALFRALSSFCGLDLVKRGSRSMFRTDKGFFKFNSQKLVKATGRLNGELGGGISWAEACDVRLDYRLDRLWIMLDPSIIFDDDENTAPDDLQAAKDFVRERRVKRYNNVSNEILDGWVEVLFGPGKAPIQLGINGGTGIGALFEILPVTAFSGLAA